MKNILRFIISLLSFVFMWPHYLSYKFSNAKPDIESDIKVLSNRTHINLPFVLSFIHILRVNEYYRTLFYHRIGRISMLLKWYLPSSKLIFFPLDIKIGGGVYLAHPCSTFINARSVGKNFTIRQNTTIGNKAQGNDDWRPMIGDNVDIGANCCIIGDISIGNNVIIGAGSVVVKSVPDNVIIVGNPARIIKHINP